MFHRTSDNKMFDHDAEIVNAITVTLHSDSDRRSQRNVFATSTSPKKNEMRCSFQGHFT